MYANGQWKHETYAEPSTKDQDQSDEKDKDKDKEVTPEPPAADPAIRAVEYFLCLFYLNIIHCVRSDVQQPLLSRITNTKPGELGLDFWVRLGTFVFIPLLSLLSAQFPELNNFFFSWLQPALQSIK